MTLQPHHHVFERFVEFINTADPEIAHEVIARDATFHVPGRPEPLRGPEGYLQIVHMMRSGFPDIQWTLEESLADSTRIAARFTMRGIHQGEFFGAPATGIHIEVQALNLYRFANEQIVEEHGHPDLLGLLGQIGALPAP